MRYFVEGLLEVHGQDAQRSACQFCMCYCLLYCCCYLKNGIPWHPTVLTNIEFLNIDGITTDNQQLIAETFNNYVASIAENIKTADRNAYVQNKNTLHTAIIAISTQYVRK